MHLVRRRRRARAGRKAAILATPINPAPLLRRPLPHRPPHSRKAGPNRTGISAAAIVAERRKWQRRRRQIAAIKIAQPLPTVAAPARKSRSSQMRTEFDPNRNNNTGRMGYNGRAGDDRNSNNGRTGFNGRNGDNRNAFNDFNREGRTNYRGPGAGGARHDFSGFRDFHRDFRASHRFQVSSYRRPAGWYTHRWAFGEFLPAAFWARDYWLVDFAEYDLPPPPYGAVWVRVDRDALLIDEDFGRGYYGRIRRILLTRHSAPYVAPDTCYKRPPCPCFNGLSA